MFFGFLFPNDFKNLKIETFERRRMENDWEIFDNVEWVNKWFVWLRIFNNFVNMVIWTFWTCSLFYTLWLFFFTTEMHFLSYYIFIYSMYLNVIGLSFLDEYLYFLDRYLRDEQRRIRIEKIEREEERIKTESEREEVIRRAKQLVNDVLRYPCLKPLMENNADPSTIMFFLQLEKKNEVLDLKIKRLKNEIIKMDKEMEPLIDKYLEINIE
jgi:hypothetical protein